MPDIHWTPAAVAVCAPLALVLLTVAWLSARWVWYRTPVGRAVREEWFAFALIAATVAATILFEALS